MSSTQVLASGYTHSALPNFHLANIYARSQTNVHIFEFFPLASLQSVRLKEAGNEKENEVDRSHLMWSLSEGTAVTAVAMHAQRLVCTMTKHKQDSLNLRVGVRWTFFSSPRSPQCLFSAGAVGYKRRSRAAQYLLKCPQTALSRYGAVQIKLS